MVALTGGEEVQTLSDTNEHAGAGQGPRGVVESLELGVAAGEVGGLDEGGGDVEAGLDEAVTHGELVGAGEFGSVLDRP